MNPFNLSISNTMLLLVNANIWIIEKSKYTNEIFLLNLFWSIEFIPIKENNNTKKLKFKLLKLPLNKNKKGKKFIRFKNLVLIMSFSR